MQGAGIGSPLRLPASRMGTPGMGEVGLQGGRWAERAEAVLKKAAFSPDSPR